MGWLITDQVDALQECVRAMGQSVEAIGVSVPGIYRAKTGSVWAPTRPGLG